MTTNPFDTIINNLKKSTNVTLNKIGTSLYVNQQMYRDKDAFLAAKFNSNNRSANRMQDILQEMYTLINGGYGGHKEYLFGRMNYLLDLAMTNCTNQQIRRVTVNPSKVTINRKKLTDLRINKTLKNGVRRDKNGRFMAKGRSKKK
jgi:hypothetical protein